MWQSRNRQIGHRWRLRYLLCRNLSIYNSPFLSIKPIYPLYFSNFHKEDMIHKLHFNLDVQRHRQALAHISSSAQNHIAFPSGTSRHS